MENTMPCSDRHVPQIKVYDGHEGKLCFDNVLRKGDVPKQLHSVCDDKHYAVEAGVDVIVDKVRYPFGKNDYVDLIACRIIFELICQARQCKASIEEFVARFGRIYKKKPMMENLSLNDSR